MNDYTFLSATILLVLITDPIGNISIFANALKHVAPERRLEWIGALCVTMLVSAVVLLSAERIQRVVGDRVVIALERLMGLVLVSVAIEMMLSGAKVFILRLMNGQGL